jgi:hypothetical protein
MTVAPVVVLVAARAPAALTRMVTGIRAAAKNPLRMDVLLLGVV